MKKVFQKLSSVPPKQPFPTFIWSEGGKQPPPEMKGGVGSIPDQYKEYKQHAFDYYVKKTLRHETCVGCRENKKRLSNELIFSDLPEAKIQEMSVRDYYPWEHSSFCVDGHVIFIENDQLAEALDLLSKKDREILLMYCFLNMSDREISEQLKLPRRTVNDRRHNAYRCLRKLMGGDQHGSL